MKELKITDCLDRQLQPGNIIALNTLREGWHIFDGIWTVVGLEYRNDGEAWTIELSRYSGLRGGPTRYVDGDWYEGDCFCHGELIVKIAEGAHLL